MTIAGDMTKLCPAGHQMKNLNSIANPEASEEYCAACGISQKMDPEKARYLNNMERTAAQQQAQRPAR